MADAMDEVDAMVDNGKRDKDKKGSEKSAAGAPASASGEVADPLFDWFEACSDDDIDLFGHGCVPYRPGRVPASSTHGVASTKIIASSSVSSISVAASAMSAASMHLPSSASATASNENVDKNEEEQEHDDDDTMVAPTPFNDAKRKDAVAHFMRLYSTQWIAANAKLLLPPPAAAATASSTTASSSTSSSLSAKNPTSAATSTTSSSISIPPDALKQLTQARGSATATKSEYFQFIMHSSTAHNTFLSRRVSCDIFLNLCKN
jgi:hypothetical protein